MVSRLCDSPRLSHSEKDLGTGSIDTERMKMLTQGQRDLSSSLPLRLGQTPSLPQRITTLQTVLFQEERLTVAWETLLPL